MTEQEKTLSRRHAAIHTIYARLLQGFEQKDWTLDKAAKEHDAIADELTKLGIEHDSPIDEGRLDFTSHSSYDMGAYNDNQLLHHHSNLHSIYSKILHGVVNTGWTMDQLIEEHERAVMELLGRGFEHDSPMEG